MQVYAAQGNLTSLHATYQRCGSALEQELGVEPSPTTKTLFAKLKNPASG
jgi:DNA-binding SARP family transcriptional activator